MAIPKKKKIQKFDDFWSTLMNMSMQVSIGERRGTMQVSIGEIREPEPVWNQSVSFLWTRILGTAYEFGLSLISLALSQCMSHLGLNTNIFDTVA